MEIWGSPSDRRCVYSTKFRRELAGQTGILSAHLPYFLSLLAFAELVLMFYS